MAGLSPSKLVTAKKTPITPEQAWSFFQAMDDWSPLMRLWAFLLWCVETASGKKMVCNNWGNLAAGGFANGVESAWWGGTYWRPSWFYAPSSALHAAMLKGQAPSAFRACSSVEQGAAQYHALLNGSRYERLRAAAETDDPAKWVEMLAVTGYSQDYKSQHVPTFQALREKWGHLLGNSLSPATCPQCGAKTCSKCGSRLGG